MPSPLKYAKSACVLAVTAALLTIASSASALDAYQDRRGAFAGVGLGGGAAFQGGESAGELMLDFQIGGGANQNLTFALDVDLWWQLFQDHTNFIVTPGPEVEYFFGDSGIFLRLGVAMALLTRTEDVKSEVGVTNKESTFDLGFDGTAGLGWEFFVNSNIAAGLSLDADYMVTPNDDIVSAGVTLSLTYY